MSKHTRRVSPASRNNRRATIAAKLGQYEPDSVWPDWGYQLGVGHCVAISDTTTRRKKHPLGFTAPTRRPK